MSAPVLQPGISTNAGPPSGLPASISRKETPLATFTMREDPTSDSARTRNPPRQMTAIRSKTAREIKVSAVRQITDERPDLLPSIARVKFCQKDRASHPQYPRLSRRLRR